LILQEEGIRAVLTAKTKSEEADEDGRDVVIPGSRKVEDNLSDLRAQVRNGYEHFFTRVVF
jgi:hypothetical protein